MTKAWTEDWVGRLSAPAAASGPAPAAASAPAPVTVSVQFSVSVSYPNRGMRL